MPSQLNLDMATCGLLTTLTSLFVRQVRRQNPHQARACIFLVSGLLAIHSDKNAQYHFLYRLSHLPKLKHCLQAWL